ncbi:hypothetical protein ACFQ0B_03585 [Nonomuraea thailandensis]
MTSTSREVTVSESTTAVVASPSSLNCSMTCSRCAASRTAIASS